MRRITRFFTSLTLSRQFMLAGLLILLLGMLGIGAWVEQQIVTGVIHRTGATTALYVDSFIAPLLQDLGTCQHAAARKSGEIEQPAAKYPHGPADRGL